MINDCNCGSKMCIPCVLKAKTLTQSKLKPAQGKPQSLDSRNYVYSYDCEASYDDHYTSSPDELRAEADYWGGGDDPSEYTAEMNSSEDEYL